MGDGGDVRGYGKLTQGVLSFDEAKGRYLRMCIDDGVPKNEDFSGSGLAHAEDEWVDSGTGNFAWKDGRKKSPKTRPIDKLPRKVVQTVIARNVELVKSVPKELLPDLAARIYKVLTLRMVPDDFIDWCVDECGVSEGRAYVIAIDQVRKAKERLKVIDWKTRGITKAMWKHRAGVKDPRDYHEMDWDGKSGLKSGRPNGLNGFVFDLDDPPVIDKKTGRRGFPSDLIGCRCYLVHVKDK